MRVFPYACLLSFGSFSVSHSWVADQQLEEHLRVMGHHDWIVIADMAYPEQSNQRLKRGRIGHVGVERNLQ